MKQMTLPAMASSVINAKFNGSVLQEQTFIANIHWPKNPMVFGTPALISVA
jgi:hypothetical protein